MIWTLLNILCIVWSLLRKIGPVPICGILWIFYDPRGGSSENVPPATCDGCLPALSSGCVQTNAAQLSQCCTKDCQ